MRPWRINIALHACLAVELIAGCSGMRVPSAALNPAVEDTDPGPLRGGAEFRVLFRFHRGDGNELLAPLTELNGKLYGTTYQGDNFKCIGGCGTIFVATTTGAARVLHAFTKTDGAGPRAGLLNIHGTLYGTTSRGGHGCHSYTYYGGCGAVFSIAPSGKFRKLYAFKGGSDGIEPEASLTEYKGDLYGSTFAGGIHGYGTVFRVDPPSGKERVLYSFAAGADGAGPKASLTFLNGQFYGTTESGGTCAVKTGCGIVYSVTPAGRERVVYRFKGSSDGMFPSSDLILSNGAFYGVTTGGGNDYQSECPYIGCGTVFSVTPAGKEQIVYAFRGTSNNDGQWPQAALTFSNGVFYSTTSGGGSAGAGTIFRMTKQGNETLLHSFTKPNGFGPNAALTFLNGMFYSTTVAGGSRAKYTWGTIFAFNP